MLRVYIAAPFADAPQVRDRDARLPIPVPWVGTRRPLSAYRRGVLRVPSLPEGMLLLEGFASLVGALPAFETRRARETLWAVVEGVDEGRDAASVRELRLASSGRGA
jgi:hypothetical protein